MTTYTERHSTEPFPPVKLATGSTVPRVTALGCPSASCEDLKASCVLGRAAGGLTGYLHSAPFGDVMLGFPRETESGFRYPMTPAQDHTREPQIFGTFAQFSPLPIDETSIAKRHPPEPDILCEVLGAGPLSFEMVELIDEDLARRAHGQIGIKKLFEQSYQELPSSRLTVWRRKFSNVLFHVKFRDDISWYGSREAVPTVMHWLETLDRHANGNVHPPSDSTAGDIVAWVNIGRGDFTSPCFDVDAVGSFADPTLDAVATKFAKSYETKHSIELLAYYELQPALPEEMWIDELRSFVQKHLGDSPFRRVWLFDVGCRKVRFAEPGLTQSTTARRTPSA